MKEGNFSLSDVFEIIDFYLQNVKFNHFLIGGGSGSEMKEIQNIVAIAQHIRKQSSKPIYAKCQPPKKFYVL